MMPTRNQVRPSTAPSTLERSQYRFNEADDRSRRSRGTTNVSGQHHHPMIMKILALRARIP